ncbi:MAG TPA: hypothetical protein VFZ78_00695 [Flavisolibacter sp.]
MTTSTVRHNVDADPSRTSPVLDILRNPWAVDVEMEQVAVAVN